VRKPRIAVRRGNSGRAYDPVVATAAPQTRPETDTEQPVPWNVVLIDDDHHTYEYVIRMMQELFAHPLEKAFQIAKTVDGDGRAVCLTTHKEHAELKRDQILAFGKDPLMAESKGSMTAVIEPAESGGDEDEGGTH
jgi:ATP-dependent Clp protease adaptor protein ClpS